MCLDTERRPDYETLNTGGGAGRMRAEAGYQTLGAPEPTLAGTGRSRREVGAGLLLALLSGLLFTGNNFVLHECEVRVVDVVLVRWLVQAGAAALLLFTRGERMAGPDWATTGLAALQGTAGSLAVVCSMLSVAYMPVPDALCIIFSNPAVTILLSALLLGEPLSLLKLLSAVLLVGGAALVCQPGISPLPSQESDSNIVGPQNGWVG